MTRPGHLALLLHAHLPFVRHPENQRHLEEHWLFEAVTDAYLPLLRVLRDAAARGPGFRITVSLSPTLLSMLADPLLRARYLDYLSRLQRLCERLISDPRSEPQRRELTRFYLQRLEGLRDFYLEDLRGDLTAAWADLAAVGIVELMTTAATHGYLPLLRGRPAAVRAQLRVARDYFIERFGYPSSGLWLPECGYYPGLEQEIADAGFRWCVVDAHGVERASPKPGFGPYAPVAACSEVVVFARDPRSAREIWCPKTGYPGHSLYREFHRDAGYDSDRDYLADFLPRGVAAAPTGLKYHRVTGGAGPKAFYDPIAARAQAELDAQSFIERRRGHFRSLLCPSRAPIAVAPYDAELFGHWWFEGPAFLESLIRKLEDTPDVLAVTLGEHLAQEGTAGAVRPAASSWGEQGYNSAWLRPDTGWVYLHLHEAAGELTDLVRAHEREPNGSRVSRLLRQAARSLLLAQSSDWTFQMGRGGGSGYCNTRLREQLARFRVLMAALRGGEIREEQLVALEAMDNLFPNLDLRHFG